MVGAYLLNTIATIEFAAQGRTTMKTSKLLAWSLVAVICCIGLSVPTAMALDYGDYDGTWYKTTFKIKATCEESASQELVTSSDSDKAWIFIVEYGVGNDAFDALLITSDADGTWQATEMSLLTRLGTANDAVLELESPITVVDGSNGDEVGVLNFFVRLTGKEKAGELKSAKLKSVAATGTLDFIGIGSCVGSLTFSGKLTKVEKVPTEVILVKDDAL
jgi:hypothetical protein